MPHPYGGFSGVAVRGLYRCFWAMGYNLRFFYGRFYAFSTDFYAFLWLILRRFWGGLGANLRKFMVCLSLFYGFLMVFLWFSYAFHGFFYGFLWLIHGRWMQLRNFTVILRAWLLKLWLFYTALGQVAGRGE